MPPPKQRINKENKRNENVAHEFERSNSTTAAFLGGRQKDWMLGKSQISESSVQKLHEPSYTGDPLRDPLDALRDEIVVAAGESNRSETSSHSIALPFLPDSARHRGIRGDKRLSKGTISTSTENANSDLPPMPETARQKPIESMRNSPLDAENALPSPSPSEGRNQEEVQTTAVRDSRDSSSVNDGTAATRLEQLMAKYGSVDEIEKHLQLADRSHAIQVQPLTDRLESTRPQTVSISDADTERAPSVSNLNRPRIATDGVSSTAFSHKRGHDTSNQSRKRAQHRSSASVDLSFWSTLSDAFIRRLSLVDRQYEELMQDCSRAVAKRIEIVAALNDRGHLERTRLDLLQEACNRCDHSYLLIHQLYCLKYAKAKTPDTQVVGVSEVHAKGFDLLKCSLVSNDDLTENAVIWFSRFPGPLSMAIPENVGSSQPAQEWYARTLRTLTEAACHWEKLRIVCSSRHIPPLVSEVLLMLRVDSVVLQQVIFRLMLRDIFVGPPDPCFVKHEEVFLRNQRQVMGDDSLVAEPPVRSNADVNFIDEHRMVWTTHMSHLPLRQEQSSRPSNMSNSTMAPPILPQIQPVGPSFPSSRSTDTGSTTASANSHAAHRASNISPFVAVPPVYSEPRMTAIPRNGNSQFINWSQHGLLRDPLSGTAQSASVTQSPITPRAPQNYEASANRANKSPGRPRRIKSMPSNAGLAHSQIVPPTGSSSPTTTVPHSITTVWRSSGRGLSAADNLQPRQMPMDRVMAAEAHVHYQQQQQPPIPAAGFGSFQIQPHQAHNNTQRPQTSNFFHPRPPRSSSDRFIRMPSPDSQIPLTVQPNPSTTALHQAQSLSPDMTASGNEQTEEKYFRFIKSVHRPTLAVSKDMRYQQRSIDLNRSEIEVLAKDTYNAVGAPLARQGHPGSLTYRIRCLKLKLGEAIPAEESWVVSDHIWPSCFTVVFNDVVLDLRRKSHYGKDLPIDVTRIVNEGPNMLTIAVLDLPENSNEQYATGLEAVQVISYTDVKKDIPVIDCHQARQNILSKAIPRDLDIEILHPDITIDLTDPFTATIFEVPARGKICQHDQCFDLETFLSTRTSTSKKKNEPSNPDEFKCPICKGDVRPGSLIIDGFFQSVRAKLQAQGRLEDTKAIVMGPNGDWVIKEEEEVSGETGDGNGRRRVPISTQPTGIDGRNTVDRGVGQHGAARTVIEIDDD
ncbi:MAG: hypothetical protein Q9164_004392 [Protoblastenia rupestris]